MRCSANNKALLPLYLLLWLLPYSVYAAPFAVTVTRAEMSLKNDNYVLSAELNYQLSDNAKEALRNGVPLFWSVRVKIKQHRNFIWDKTLIEKALRYRIEYHALLNMYRIRNENNGDTNNFSTLSSALELMSAIRDFSVISKHQIIQKNRYSAEVKVDFDRNALPLPLRPIAALDPQWYLSSDWTVWPLNNNATGQ
ncbi:MAG: DUF4390 domain-containing protein [Methylococcaceae bacterium]